MKWKNMTAWILAGSLILGAAPGAEALAAPKNYGAETESSSGAEEGSGMESSAQAESGGMESSVQAESDSVERSVQAESDSVESSVQAESGGAESSGQEEESTPQLNYLYLTPGEQAESAGQVLVASLELEGRDMTQAVLTWQAEDGSQQLLEADEIREGYAVFVGEGVPMAQEQLDTLKVTVEGEETLLDLQEFQSAEDTQIEERAPENQEGEGQGKARALAGGQEEQVEEVVAEDSQGIGAALTQAQSQIEESSAETVQKRRDGEASTETPTETPQEAHDVIIVLDPGHGGSDGGAVRTWKGVRYLEKEINLKISQYTKAELETYEGVQVYLTRDSDVAVGLEARVQYAADLGASAIVSQHINSTSKVQDTASGSLVFVASGNYRKEIAQEGWDMAGIILEELEKLGLKNNGLIKNLSETGNTYPNGKLADYYAIVRYGILKKVPGIIVEHAFVNNPSDCKTYFNSEESLKSLGVADATALARYYGLEKKDGSDVNLSQGTYGWKQENGRWYYQKTDGTRMKGFNIIDGNVYYFDSSGYRVTGWQNLEISRYYFQSDGVMSKYLTKIGKKYYYFNSKGWLMKGLFNGKGKKRYYANSRGVLQTGWKKIGKKRYYFEPGTFAAATGLKKISGKWYYFGPKGVMQTGWQTIEGFRYYFRPDGTEKTGWDQRGKKWYYISKKTGKIVKRTWVKSKKKYYYLNKKGVMLANTKRVIKGKKYRFDASGACLNKKK